MTSAKPQIDSEEARFHAEEQQQAALREAAFYAGLPEERRAGTEQAERRAKQRAAHLAAEMARWDAERAAFVAAERAEAKAQRIAAAIAAREVFFAEFSDHYRALTAAVRPFVDELRQVLDRLEAFDRHDAAAMDVPYTEAARTDGQRQLLTWLACELRRVPELVSVAVATPTGIMQPEPAFVLGPAWTPDTEAERAALAEAKAAHLAQIEADRAHLKHFLVPPAWWPKTMPGVLYKPL
ncbi:MAG TPA: hypothetical protein VKV26_08900 [Dehalococcoidia bacterium]|nr:hypothetical protein [Dehalococcoidia bacterium]